MRRLRAILEMLEVIDKRNHDGNPDEPSRSVIRVSVLMAMADVKFLLKGEGPMEAPVTHNSTYPYPNIDQFKEAALVILAKLRGEVVELNCLVQAGYVAEGFAFKQLFPHGPFMDDAAEALAAVAALLPFAGIGPLDWKLFLSWILDLIKQWLTSVGT